MPPKVTKKHNKSSKPTLTPASKLEEKLDHKIGIVTKPKPKRATEFTVDTSNNNARYWLIKSEPLSRIDPNTGKDAKFPLSDLLSVEYEPWDGVRNYEARNNMLNMRKNDILLFYHSNTKNPGIVGLAKVYHEAHPDLLQFDHKSNYYDGKSTSENPKWWCVDVCFFRRLRAKVSLEELRENPKLQEMSLVKRGRLSVTPVRKEEYYEVLSMEQLKPISDDLDCEIDRKYIEVEN